ncbi:DNA-binding response regulator [Croceivirga lutea]|uniref:response regulator transcription factor n=1 Tax=Croceivirga lutea TaxID=1775167 RepID=UPI00163B33B8|nr:response regulator transcription factor [Croceivirga lutea]GGG51696.1 DNA-binding response regulator [Croceivirga lutea]
MALSNIKIRVVIVDDHPLVIEGLKSLLKGHKDIKVEACCTTGNEALEFLKQHQADIVLLDINLPDVSGTEICKVIANEYENTFVIGLSTYGERSIINQMISNGAKGYLLKNVTESELVEAISKVYRGHYYYGIEIQKAMANTIFHTMGNTPRLTKREKQILKLIVSGKTTNKIADELFISPLTVETHRRNLMKKMDASNTASLVKIAIEKVLV